MTVPALETMVDPVPADVFERARAAGKSVSDAPFRYEAGGCNCGCNLSYDAAVSNIMRTSMLNQDQAEDSLNNANRARQELATQPRLVPEP